MIHEVGKSLQLQWHQLIPFVIGISFSYFLTVVYRKRYVPQEYHRVFFFAMAVAYPFILLTSWFLNIMIMNCLGYNVVVSFADLIILITFLSILVGRSGIYLAKAKKKSLLNSKKT